MISALKAGNLALAFLLELAVLVGIGVWGFHVAHSTASRALVGIGAPLLWAVIWGLVGAPNATFHLSGAAAVAFQLVWFGAGAVALFVAGHRAPGLVLAALWVLNSVLLHLWHQG